MLKYFIMLLLTCLVIIGCNEKIPEDALAKVGDKYVTKEEFLKQFSKLTNEEKKNTITEEGRKAFLKTILYKELMEKEAFFRKIDESSIVKDRLNKIRENWILNELFILTISKPSEINDSVFNEIQKKWNEELFVQVVVLETREKANEFRDRAIKGEKWTDLAPIYGITNWEVGLKGELGWLLFGALGTDLDEFVWSLPLNEVSAIHEINPGAFCVARVLKRRPTKPDVITKEVKHRFWHNLYEKRRWLRLKAVRDSSIKASNAKIDSAAFDIFMDNAYKFRGKGKYSARDTTKGLKSVKKFFTFFTPDQKKMIILTYNNKQLTIEELLKKLDKEGPYTSPNESSIDAMRHYLFEIAFIDVQLNRASELKIDTKKELLDLLEKKKAELVVDELYNIEVLKKVDYKSFKEDDKIKYYESNKLKFLGAPPLKVAWIINENEDTLKSILKTKSFDFSETAKKYSIHDTKSNGGERGWITEKDPFLGKFFSVLQKLNKNEVSNVLQLETNKGKPSRYTIVKILEKGLPQPKAYNDCKNDVIDVMIFEWREKRLQDFLSELYSKYKTREFFDNLAKMELKVEEEKKEEKSDIKEEEHHHDKK
ncbi:MAG: peptidylprolyl isomerase [Candidatus Coatesbacteria bacterium]|nr:peptidylprolyl isomerase [Candidatus Coatesbacteria bacterium]